MPNQVASRVGGAVTFIATAVLVGGALSGFANANSADAHAAETVAAVQKVAPDTLANVAEAAATATEAAVATSDSGTVTVPLDPSTGVRLTSAKGDSMEHGSIALPFTDRASDAATTSSGAVVYDNKNGSSTIPVVHDDGSVQITTVIENAEAPTRFDYKLSLAPDQRIVANSDGGVSVTDRDGAAIGIIEAPWATDANGNAVRTKYEINGNTVTQVVHTDAGTAYPVVADPTYWWGGKEWWSSARVNVSLVSAGIAGYTGLAGPAIIVGSALALCNQAGKGIWVYWTWAGQAWCTGP